MEELIGPTIKPWTGDDKVIQLHYLRCFVIKLYFIIG